MCEIHGFEATESLLSWIHFGTCSGVIKFRWKIIDLTINIDIDLTTWIYINCNLGDRNFLVINIAIDDRKIHIDSQPCLTLSRLHSGTVTQQWPAPVAPYNIHSQTNHRKLLKATVVCLPSASRSDRTKSAAVESGRGRRIPRTRTRSDSIRTLSSSYWMFVTCISFVQCESLENWLS